MQTKDKRHHQDLKPNHFRVSSSSQYSNKLWVQSWQSFCQPSGRISHFHQSISQSAFQHLLPPTLFLSSLSTIWCYLLRQLDIIPSTLPCILSLLHKLLSFSPFTPLSLSLSGCMWIDDLLLCWMSGCPAPEAGEDTPASGGTPEDKGWLHVPLTSGWWSWQQVCACRLLCQCVSVRAERTPLILTSHSYSTTADWAK